MKRDVFQGLADPTRRQILRVTAHRSLNVNAVASKFDISRSAIYKHMKILSECGLLVIKQNGRERYCEPRLYKLAEVSNWIDRYHMALEKRFNSLERYLGRLKTKKKMEAKIGALSKRKTNLLQRVFLIRGRQNVLQSAKSGFVY